jgi:hypothetical protein
MAKRRVGVSKTRAQQQRTSRAKELALEQAFNQCLSNIGGTTLTHADLVDEKVCDEFEVWQPLEELDWRCAALESRRHPVWKVNQLTRILKLETGFVQRGFVCGLGSLVGGFCVGLSLMECWVEQIELHLRLPTTV